MASGSYVRDGGYVRDCVMIHHPDRKDEPLFRVEDGKMVAYLQDMAIIPRELYEKLAAETVISARDAGKV